MVVSQAPGQCRSRGTYFATKAAQTKLQLAQRHGWRLWIAGDESEGIASSAAVAAGNDTAAASQLGLLLALHDARPPPRWLLWLDSELLVTNPRAELPLAEYEAGGTQLVLWGEEGGAGSDRLVVDAAVLALRVGTWSAALLAAALDLATDSAARSRHHTGRSVSALLAELLRAPRWRQHTRLERERPLFAHWRSVAPLLAGGDDGVVVRVLLVLRREARRDRRRLLADHGAHVGHERLAPLLLLGPRGVDGLEGRVLVLRRRVVPVEHGLGVAVDHVGHGGRGGTLSGSRRLVPGTDIDRGPVRP